jgi:hypothetical protein
VRHHGSTAYSHSAVGHRAFVELLRELDVPVTISRWESSAKAGDSAVLVIAEPRLYDDLPDMLDEVRRAIVVLPKWRVWRDPENPRFVEGARLRDAGGIERRLDRIGLELDLVRLPKGAPVGGLTVNRLGPEPDLPRAQLAVTSDLDPVVASGSRILVGRWGTQGRVLVLTDPDLISNHGLRRGENAALAVAMVEMLRDGGRPVVFDETLHGFEARPNVFVELFRFPLLLVVVQAALVLALILWAGAGRFGAPRREEPGLETAGKAVLIENTANLLLFGGHSRAMLERYLATTLREAGRALQAPEGLRDDELRAWLAKVARRRGVTEDLERLREEVRAPERGTRRDRARVLSLARRVHRFRKEILDGSGKRA